MCEHTPEFQVLGASNPAGNTFFWELTFFFFSFFFFFFAEQFFPGLLLFVCYHIEFIMFSQAISH